MIKLRLDVGYVRYLQQERVRINKTRLSEIEFYEDGKKLEVPKEIIKGFEFTGLANVDFITSNYYKRKQNEN